MIPPENAVRENRDAEIEYITDMERELFIRDADPEEAKRKNYSKRSEDL